MPYETAYLTIPFREGAGEDRVDVLRLEDGCVLVVADGVGGRSGGGEAAMLFVENVVNYFVTADYVVSGPALEQLFMEIDAALADDEIAGETTGLVAVVRGDMITGVAVGDSEARLVLPDDDFMLVHGGGKPFLGSGAAFPVSFEAELVPGSVLLLGTDGLFKYAPEGRIIEAVRSRTDRIDIIARRLIDSARIAGGQLCGDISVALCRNSSLE